MKISVALSVVATAASTTAPIVHAFVASPLSTPKSGQAAALGSSSSSSSIVSSSSPKIALIATQHHHGRGVLRMVSDDGGSSPARLVLKDSGRLKSNDGADAFFYGNPRICYHVDQGFLTHLTSLYRERIPPGGAVLDMMSSWVSHLPPDVTFSRVDGQGMNLEELGRNPRLDTKRVWDLNADPRLPFEDVTYDAVVCAVSVQYLQQPEKIFADVRRVLKPGGVAIFSFSNRMFSDKAISAWINRSAKGRLGLVSEYFNAAGGFGPPETIEMPAQEGAGFFTGFQEMFGMAGTGDPFFAVVATKEA